VLRPPGHLGLDAGIGQRLLQQAAGVRDPGFAIAAALVEQVGDAPVGFRLQVAEGQVLKLPLQLPDAEAIGQWRMDVGGELGNGAALVVSQRASPAHHHQLPGEQDEDHAQVADDRQQQAPQAFGSTRAVARGMQRPDLFRSALALDQLGNLAAECSQLHLGKFAAGAERLVHEQGRARDRPGGQLVEFGKNRVADRDGRVPASTCGWRGVQPCLDTLQRLIAR